MQFQRSSGRLLIPPRLKAFILPIAVSSLLAFVLYSTTFHILLPTSEPLRDVEGLPQFTGSDSFETLLPDVNPDGGSNLTMWSKSNPSASLSPLEDQGGNDERTGQSDSSQRWSNMGGEGKSMCGEPPSVPLTVLTELDDPLAVCLDGSPPAYHFSPGFGSGSNRWMVFLEGGGWCHSISDCHRRSLTRFGSSVAMADTSATYTFTGLFSNCSSDNPAFYNWNIVYIRYCDGASYSGSVVEPVAVEGQSTPIYFRGQHIFNAVISHLLSTRAMSSATHVLLAGCSAGGLGAYLHCDQMAERMRGGQLAGTVVSRRLLDDGSGDGSSDAQPSDAPRSPVVKCMGDAGFFLDTAGEGGEWRMRHLFKTVVHMQNTTMDPRCLMDRPAGDRWQCFFPEYFLSYTLTPLMVINPLYDNWQVEHSFLPKQGWSRCRHSLGLCTRPQLEALHAYRTEMITKVTSALQRPTRRSDALNPNPPEAQEEALNPDADVALSGKGVGEEGDTGGATERGGGEVGGEMVVRKRGKGKGKRGKKKGKKTSTEDSTERRRLAVSGGRELRGSEEEEGEERSVNSNEEGSEGESKEEGGEGDSNEGGSEGVSKEGESEGDSNEGDGEGDRKEESSEGDDKEGRESGKRHARAEDKNGGEEEAEGEAGEATESMKTGVDSHGNAEKGGRTVSKHGDEPPLEVDDDDDNPASMTFRKEEANRKVPDEGEGGKEGQSVGEETIEGDDDDPVSMTFRSSAAESSVKSGQGKEKRGKNERFKGEERGGGSGDDVAMVLKGEGDEFRAVEDDDPVTMDFRQADSTGSGEREGKNKESRSSKSRSKGAEWVGEGDEQPLEEEGDNPLQISFQDANKQKQGRNGSNRRSRQSSGKALELIGEGDEQPLEEEGDNPLQISFQRASKQKRGRNGSKSRSKQSSSKALELIGEGDEHPVEEEGDNPLQISFRGASKQKMGRNGALLSSCFIHCQTLWPATWAGKNASTVLGESIASALAEWYFEDKAAFLADCPYPCNPTCFNWQEATRT